MTDVILFCNQNAGALILCALFLSITALVLLILLLRGQKEKNAEQKGRMDELDGALSRLPAREEVWQQLYAQSAQTAQSINDLSRRLDAFGDAQDARLSRMSSSMDTRLNQSGENVRQMRETLARSVGDMQKENQQKLDQVRETLTQSVGSLQKDNAEKLEKMRETVDEKLHATLDKRLGESFGLVNERLEQVYKGLGEMQTLAGSVGDLKRVLTNVKSRGIWGETQLGALLSEILDTSQYDENVSVVPGAKERVEYAIRLPGKEDAGIVYLPIDSKYPIEAYERLLTANEAADPALIAQAETELRAAVRTEAKRISEKYIRPPYTTEFAVMFLPTEGLYAEVLRCRGLTEEMQQQFRVVVSGPSTLTALLNSLQMGFHTLAIEKRSDEVWQLLGAIKTEMGKFADLLSKTKKNLDTTSDTIGRAVSKTTTIQRKLKAVQTLPDTDAMKRLDFDDALNDENAGFDQADE